MYHLRRIKKTTEFCQTHLQKQKAAIRSSVKNRCVTQCSKFATSNKHNQQDVGSQAEHDEDDKCGQEGNQQVPRSKHGLLKLYTLCWFLLGLLIAPGVDGR
jgi:hypothetical protein